MSDLRGQQIYLTHKQLEFLYAITDSINALENDRTDEIRRKINDKMSRALEKSEGELLEEI